MPSPRIPEAAVARIWNDGLCSRELRTTDGRRVAIVYRGVWTHSNGPDFRDAMLEVAGKLVTGSVELHVDSRDWFAHGHHENPAYDDVVLHVVMQDDAGTAAHGPSGIPIPTVVLEPFLTRRIEQLLTEIPVVNLGAIGTTVCLPTLAGGRTDEIHQLLQRAGWERMQEKQLRLQQDLLQLPPGEVLYRSLLDSLGLAANRSGMLEVAIRAPLAELELAVRESGIAGAQTLLMLAGGFHPDSPAGGPAWNLNRVRPLNHPSRRLESMASLAAGFRYEGLLATFLQLPLDGGRSWDRWLASANPAFGASRRHQIMINSLAPFLAAYAEANGDELLLEAAYEQWERIPGKVDDDIARRTLRQITGGQRFPIKLALEVQGLHRIGRQGCANLRCFECPVAHLAVMHEPLIATPQDGGHPSAPAAPDPQSRQTHTSA